MPTILQAGDFEATRLALSGERGSAADYKIALSLELPASTPHHLYESQDTEQSERKGRRTNIIGYHAPSAMARYRRV